MFADVLSKCFIAKINCSWKTCMVSQEQYISIYSLFFMEFSDKTFR